MSQSTAPESLGAVDPELFEQLRAIIPPDTYDQFSVRVDQLKMTHEASHREEILQAVNPITVRVIEDFVSANDGVEPTEVRLDVAHSKQVRTRGENWHQILLFPKALLYETHSANPTEFAVGEVPGLSFMPNFILSSLTKGLVAQNRLGIHSLEAGTLMRSDTRSIRRRQDTHPDGVISVSLDVFNGYLSLEAVESSKKEDLRAMILARR